MTETVNIIGAEIGGLTTALILKQKGLNVNIFEGSNEIKPVGAGIVIANNAMQVFKKMGIQDKIEKGGCLIENEPSIEKTFKTYEDLRRKKAHKIVNTSWRFGKMAQMENGFGIWLRNLVLQNAPKSLNKKQMEMIFNIN
ncbi:FAD-dependent monooxygenase [Flavobacterium sp. LPB0248]|uniref:FAD-dependent monooxygenase n=1 Tax=Flavobacterium sp. LPB0248 TaxID=2614441 RepID=UPI0015A5CA96|nr:FAD-dependent monooxygenase [Flavobacterium sp. LPB0248]QLC67208.1 FAD-dependent monooxygenase [Flavobacterium sp. LPB0248]